MGFWRRLFGRKTDPTVQRGPFNPSVTAQQPSNTRAKPAQVQAKPQSTASQGIATLLKVCSNRRSRLGSLEDDQSFKQAMQELKREGSKGALALAALINDLLAARCAEIEDVLVAAARLPSHPDLINAVQRVLSAPPVIAGQPGRFPPVIFGGGKIGWDDATAGWIKDQASQALASLRAAPEAPAVIADSQQLTAAPEKQHPTDPAVISIACKKCNRQYNLGVDAAVVTDEGLGDNFAFVVGSIKGGGPDSPDLVAPLPAGRIPTQDMLREVARVQRVRDANASRYWKCNLCDSVYPYPWVR